MIEKMVINMALKSMKDNFLSLSDEEKQKEFCKLLDKNQELKEKLDKYENPEDMTLMMMWCTEKVKDKNQELKKQLEEKDDFINKLQETKNKLDKWDYKNTMKQKEFIKYLEDYQDGASKSLDSYDCGINDCLGDVLSKYKEIVNGSEHK